MNVPFINLKSLIMKIFKNLWVLTLLIANTISAQSVELIETLNIEQIRLLDKSSKIIKENRHEFRALLNEEQKALLRDESFPRRERMAQLKASLSADQLNIFQANRMEDKESRKAFRRSLSPEQHTILKEAKKRGTHRPSTKEERKKLLEKIKERKKLLEVIE